MESVKTTKQFVKDYLKEIETISKKSGAIEATYYSSIEALIKKIAKEEDIEGVEVLAQITKKSGKNTVHRPDFVVLKKSLVLGYIEAKNVNVDIGDLKNTDQIKKYANDTPNILLTNFKDFELLTYVNEEIISKKASFNNSNDAYDVIKDFLLKATTSIKSKEELMYILVSVGKKIRDELLVILNNKNEKIMLLKEEIYGSAFDSDNISSERFCDNFAEMIVFARLFSKIEGSKSLLSIPILREWIKSINLGDEDLNDYSDIDKELKLNVILLNDIINNIDDRLLDIFKVRAGDNFKKLYHDFYEEFLNQYDKDSRKNYGVYYTDESISYFINKSINSILKQKFNLNRGLADESVELLDFATGSGTFIEEALKIAFNELSDDEKPVLGKDILTRFYGFEIMMSSYILCMFKLGLLIKEELKLSSEDYNKIKPSIYLTNTLNPSYGGRRNSQNEHSYNNFHKANQIKNSNNLLVIEGNPPYKNGSALNTLSKRAKGTSKEFISIANIMEEYKPEGERKSNINDDYVRFIAFAQNKIRNQATGVVGIITNHNFISAITFRKMRETLLKDFDEIYILDLHGNLRKGLDAGDKNVFDIQQGVSINFFIKTPNYKKDKACKVFHHELVGSRQYKYDILSSINFNDVPWEAVDYKDFDNKLAKTKWGKTLGNLNFFTPRGVSLIKEYGKYWGIKDIFIEYNVGIQTSHDDFAISFNKAEAENKIDDILTLVEKDFRTNYSKKKDEPLKDTDWDYKKAKEDAEKNYANKPYENILYKPFDKRITWYSKQKGIVTRPTVEIMSHMLNIKNNMGLCFTRVNEKNEFNNIFITKNIVDCHVISAKDYIAPLYILAPNRETLVVENIPNFKPDFTKFVNGLPFKPTTEAIMFYIYAILNTPAYGEKYNELLSIDFPRVFFTEDEKIFNSFRDLGEKLYKAHTLDESYMRSLKQNKEKEFNKINDFLSDAKGSKCANIELAKVISSDILNYTIGSYEVIKKYLGYRKDVDLDDEIKLSLINMIFAIDETISLKKELDVIFKLIDEY